MSSPTGGRRSRRPILAPLDAAFAPPGEAWQPVSPRLATAQRVSLLLAGVPLLFLAAVLWAVFADVRGVVLAVGSVVVATFAWLWWLIGRRVRAFGYAERADDLLVTGGIMFRRLTVVPYGRMQLVDLRAGPLDRAVGITSVTLHTASATTDAVIPGLPPAEAARLRDRLASLGEQRSAGL